MSALTTDVIQKVASLARLTISDEEIEQMKEQLGSILEYVDRLAEVDTDDVEPLVHAVETTNVFRADEPRPSLPRDAALANSPLTDGRSFLVPPILEAH